MKGETKVERWADDPLLRLASRWVAIGGVPALGGLCWAALTYAAGFEARFQQLEQNYISQSHEIAQIDERLRQRETDAFTETDAAMLLNSVQRELDLLNRNVDSLRDDLRDAGRRPPN